MPGKEFDPHKFIDRDFERELFEELLGCKDQTRILAIEDTCGEGKSHLLLQFRYRCRTGKPRTSVSLVKLDQLSNNSPLALVQKIAEDLSAFYFPTFTRLENARKGHDFATIRGAVDLRWANLQNAQIEVGGVIVKYAESVTMPSTPTELNPEQQAIAQKESVRAFFDDLKTYCNKQPVVLMLDAYEKCDPDLKTWLVETLLEQYYFDLEQRPQYLLLVIAGQEIPPFHLHWASDDCQTLVKSVRALSKWSRADVEKCLRVHGFNYAEQKLDTFYSLIEIGLPPLQVVDVIETAVAVQVRPK